MFVGTYDQKWTFFYKILQHFQYLRTKEILELQNVKKLEGYYKELQDYNTRIDMICKKLVTVNFFLLIC